METTVLVIGAGPAGSSAAFYLAQRGVRVLLADKRSFPREKVCGDGVSPAAVRFLFRIGALRQEEVENGRCRTFQGGYVYGPSGGRFRMHYPHHPGPGAFRRGCTMRRYELDSLLLDRAVQAGCCFLSEFRATEPVYDRGRIAGFRGQHRGRSLTIKAKLVVLATGADLALVRALDLYRPGGTSVVGMRGYYRCREALYSDPYLELHFDPHLTPGYGWVFPIDDRVVNVGVATPLGPRLRRAGGIRAAFERFTGTNPRVREALVGAQEVEPPRGAVLRTDFLYRKACAEGALAAGEAAGLADPFTGEGIALALQSGEAAGQAAYEAVGADDFSQRRLASYERALRQRYAAYFCLTARLRSRLADPRAVDALVSFTRHALQVRAAGWPVSGVASLAGHLLRSWPAQRCVPCLSIRMLLSRSKAIEAR
jgi:geranylgeranyl reductase family protein